MAELIQEPIKVGVVFGNTKIKPRWFIWGSRRIDITEVNYTWKTKEGKNTFYHFAVSDGINVFELSYDSEGAKWELTAMDPG